MKAKVPKVELNPLIYEYYFTITGYYRTFLSDAYPREDLWKKYCSFKPFQEIVPGKVVRQCHFSFLL